MKEIKAKRKLELSKIISILFIGVGLYLLTTNLIEQLSWEKKIGLVVELKARKESKTQLYPVVEFEIETENFVQVAIKQSSNRLGYSVGDEIPIIYPKDDFKKAKINSIAWVYGFPFIFIGLGIIGFFIPSKRWHVS